MGWQLLQGQAIKIHEYIENNNVSRELKELLLQTINILEDEADYVHQKMTESTHEKD